MIKETKKVYEVIIDYWMDLHKECMEINPTRKSLTLGQKACQNAYYSASHNLDYALQQIDYVRDGNPNVKPYNNGQPHINSYSMDELKSLYETTNLDFYETGLLFRQQRMLELNQEVQKESLIKEIIEKFVSNEEVQWSLSYQRKANVKSKASVQEVITYVQSEIDKVSEELASKGLLSIKR